MNRFPKKSSLLRGTSYLVSSKYVYLMALLVVSITLMGAILVLLERQDKVDKAHLTLAIEQRQLSDSIANHVREAAQGHRQAFENIEIARKRFDEILNIQKNDDPASGLSHLPEAVMTYVDELDSRWQQTRADIDRILAKRELILESTTAAGGEEYALDFLRAQGAGEDRDLVSRISDLQAATGRLLSQYLGAAGTVEILGFTIGMGTAYSFGVLTLILLALMHRQQFRDAQLRLTESERRKQETEEQNRRNQDAILRLLDEMGDLAEGDLTVQANVTEDITGAIADSINYAVEALRELVTTINDTSEQVASAAQQTRAVADRLVSASGVQTRQIESASKMVAQMAHSMDDMSSKMATSAEVAGKSVNIAHEGGDRVRRTIQGMDAIREHIQETSKRIKRLGESSQEIGDIVELINDIADQTNILALNAAIQAAAAGEAGRGFAVVADEVQRLAERSGNATKRIETLVKTIQTDTNEAISSMEKSTTEVVNGARLAETAGGSLDEIETVSARLAKLIDELSNSARGVVQMADRVSATMTTINEITNQTAEGSMTTAASIGKLTQLAQELRESVAGFQLPDQDPVKQALATQALPVRAVGNA